jgi:FtsZ-binding cell division protein ZapB
MSSIPVPIPTLPISSTTGAQSVQIASLTSQIEELVKKNTALTQQHERARSEVEAKLAEEVSRGIEAVQRIREAHKAEVQTWKDRCETVRMMLSTLEALQSL